MSVLFARIMKGQLVPGATACSSQRTYDINHSQTTIVLVKGTRDHPCSADYPIISDHRRVNEPFQH